MAALPDSFRIGHVSLRVKDVDRSLQFYAGLLGLRLIARQGAEARLSPTGDEPALLALQGDPAYQPRPPRTAGLFHTALLLPSRRDLARLLRRLLAQGWPLQGASDHGVSEAIYLADPDGNGLELYADQPRETWQRRGAQVAMTTRPLDLPGLLALAPVEEADQGASAIPAATCIGHIHLGVGDLDRAEAFYHAALGLDVTLRGYPGALFFAAGGYHHHVGANIWSGHLAPPAPAGTVGLAAVSFVVESASARAGIAARLQAAGFAHEQREDGLAATDADQNRVLILPHPEHA